MRTAVRMLVWLFALGSIALGQSVPTLSGSGPYTWTNTVLSLTSGGIPMACNDSSGSGTAQSCTTSPSITPTSGTSILYSTTTQNTGDVTINVDSTSAVHVRKYQGSSVLASGDLKASVPVLLTYDGTYWEIGGNIGNAPGGSGTVTSIATTAPLGGGTITTSGTLTCATCVVATVNPTAGLLRVAGSTQTATGAELSGDVTTSGSNAATVVQVEGAAIPASATVLGTNSSKQLIAAALTTGQVWNGSSNLPSGTTTPTLGASGTLGSLTFGNATSGLLTLEPTTGAITSYTLALPVAQPTAGNTFLSCTAASPAVCTWTAGGGGGTPAYPLTITGGVSGGVVYGNSSTSLTVSPAGTVNTLMKWGGAGAAPAASSVTDNATTVTTTEPLFTSYSGTASQASLYATGAPYTGGSATTNFPLGYLNSGAGPTSFSTHGTMWGLNAPSGFTGDFEYFCVNGTPAVGACPFEMTYQGNAIITQTSGTQFALNLQNVTASTSSTAQSSPYDIRSGTGWYNPEFDTGSPPVAAASVQDCWSHQVIETNGSNGVSIYNIAHNNAVDTCAGIPSASFVQVPYQVSFGVATQTIAQAAAPTVAAQGTTGATSWSYAIVACVGQTCSQVSTATQITNGNATLGTSTIWNKVTWSAVTNADYYKVYRTQAGGTPSTTGDICLIPAGVTLECDDKALTADGTTGQAYNSSGQVYVGSGPPVGGGSGGGQYAYTGTAPLSSTLTGLASTAAGWYANSTTPCVDLEATPTVGTVTDEGCALAVNNVNGNSLAYVDKTAQTAALSAQPFFTPTVTGRYLISYYAKVTTIGTTSILGGTTGLTLAYTDGTDSVAQTAFTLPETSQAGNTVAIATGNTTNTTQATLTGSAMIYAKTGVAVTYGFGYTSTGTAMQYELHLSAEAK